MLSFPHPHLRTLLSVARALSLSSSGAGKWKCAIAEKYIDHTAIAKMLEDGSPEYEHLLAQMTMSAESPAIGAARKRKKTLQKAIASDSDDSDDDSDVEIVDNNPNSSANILKALKELFGQEKHLKTLEDAAVECGSVSAAVEQVMVSTNPEPSRGYNAHRSDAQHRAHMSSQLLKKSERQAMIDANLARVEANRKANGGWLNSSNINSSRGGGGTSSKDSKRRRVAGNGQGKGKGKPRSKRKAWESGSSDEETEAETTAEEEDSDEDSDSDGGAGGGAFRSYGGSRRMNRRVQSHESALAWFNTCPLSDLSALKGCSEIKAKILVRLRPFEDYEEMLEKLDNTPKINSDLVTAYVELLELRRAVGGVLQTCLDISERIREKKLVEKSKKRQRQIPATLSPNLALKDFQHEGLQWMAAMDEENLNMILADEMGLGKTIQSIAFVAHLHARNRGRGSSAIVVPSSVLDNWANEFAKWCPSLKICYLHGKDRDDKLEELLDKHNKHDYDVILTTYNVATVSGKKAFTNPRVQLNLIIFDEGHMLKNLKSQRYQALQKVSARRRLLLTGTPLQNNLLELISLLSFVKPELFHGGEAGETADHLSKFFAGTASGKMGDAKQREMIGQARGIMDPFVLRRKKDDVLDYLPKKHSVVKDCSLEGMQRAAYVDLVFRFASRGEERRAKSKAKVAGGPDGLALMASPTVERASKTKARSASYKELSDREYFKQKEVAEAAEAAKAVAAVAAAHAVQQSKRKVKGKGKMQSKLSFASKDVAKKDVIVIDDSDDSDSTDNADSGGGGAGGGEAGGERGGGGAVAATATATPAAAAAVDVDADAAEAPIDAAAIASAAVESSKAAGLLKVQNVQGLENVMIQLRKLVNHPLLHRIRYNDSTLHEMTAAIMKEPQYHDASAEYIFEDMEVMNDFELDRMCHEHGSLRQFRLPQDALEDSAKLRELGPLLKAKDEAGDRVLIFSQFLEMLDILGCWLKRKGYKFLRIDGSTKVDERQKLIDKYSKDNTILVFLLATRAGGQGINLTAANVAILHDLDYNPQQDRQAEARVHRHGQEKEVTVYRMVAKDTVEELMMEMAERKLKLDDDMSGAESTLSKEDVFKLLQRNAALFMQKDGGVAAAKVAAKVEKTDELKETKKEKGASTSTGTSKSKSGGSGDGGGGGAAAPASKGGKKPEKA